MPHRNLIMVAIQIKNRHSRNEHKTRSKETNLRQDRHIVFQASARQVEESFTNSNEVEKRPTSLSKLKIPPHPTSYIGNVCKIQDKKKHKTNRNTIELNVWIRKLSDSHTAISDSVEERRGKGRKIEKFEQCTDETQRTS